MAKAGVEKPVLDIFEDFQCPACKALEETSGATIKNLAAEGKAKVVYHPITIFTTPAPVATPSVPAPPPAASRRQAVDRVSRQVVQGAAPETAEGFKITDLVAWGKEAGSHRSGLRKMRDRPGKGTRPSRVQHQDLESQKLTGHADAETQRQGAGQQRRLQAKDLARPVTRRPSSLAITVTSPDMPLASIPSPSQGVWYLGLVPIRAYALCIVLGVIVAVWLERTPLARPWRRAGHDHGHRRLGGDLRPGRRSPLPRHHRLAALLRRPRDQGADEALFIWNGGLGIWGAVALGGVGVWLGLPQAGPRPWARWPTRSRPASCSRRRSAAGATGSTRSCTAARPRCRGAWRSTRRTGRRAGGASTTRRSCTSRSGTWRWASPCSGSGKRFALRHGRLFALYVAGYTAGPVLDRGAARSTRSAGWTTR